MVDLQARTLAADLIEKFRDGAISNFDFQDSYPRFDKHDRALRAVQTMLWRYYDDCREHTMTEEGHLLTPEGRELFDRCALFLRTRLEYLWPEDNFVGIGGLGIVGRICTLGLSVFFDRALERRAMRELEVIEAIGSTAVWPFFTTEEYSQHRGKSG